MLVITRCKIGESPSLAASSLRKGTLISVPSGFVADEPGVEAGRRFCGKTHVGGRTTLGIHVPARHEFGDRNIRIVSCDGGDISGETGFGIALR